MRYCIKGIVDPMFYKHAKVDAIQTTKNRMAGELAKEFIKTHSPAEPMRDPKTGDLVMLFDMEIVSDFDAELLRENARQWAYRLAREDIKREIPYGMDPDAQDVV